MIDVHRKSSIPSQLKSAFEQQLKFVYFTYELYFCKSNSANFLKMFSPHARYRRSLGLVNEQNLEKAEQQISHSIVLVSNPL